MLEFGARTFVDDMELRYGRSVKQLEDRLKYDLARKLSDEIINKNFQDTIITRNYDPFSYHLPGELHFRQPGTEYELRVFLLTRDEATEYRKLKAGKVLTTEEFVEYQELKKLQEQFKKLIK
ncbi:MAG TPA: hypothetical protein VK190_04550 [Pseudoneobacillus sp.]|nr:hypothetical protein [Pseudoneobacillus sp.]